MHENGTTADGEPIVMSLERAKELANRIYNVPTSTEDHAGIVIDIADLVLAQAYKIKRLSSATPNET